MFNFFLNFNFIHNLLTFLRDWKSHILFLNFNVNFVNKFFHFWRLIISRNIPFDWLFFLLFQTLIQSFNKLLFILIASKKNFRFLLNLWMNLSFYFRLLFFLLNFLFLWPRNIFCWWNYIIQSFLLRFYLNIWLFLSLRFRIYVHFWFDLGMWSWINGSSHISFDRLLMFMFRLNSQFLDHRLRWMANFFGNLFFTIEIINNLFESKITDKLLNIWTYI